MEEVMKISFVKIKQEKSMTAVSYTHLDVYKRQGSDKVSNNNAVSMRAFIKAI